MLQPSLKLTILASHGKALASGACASFAPQGGNIGRAADSTLRLPDDDTVAERHAVIRAQYGASCLLNIGGHAALTVNGKPIAVGQEIRLQSGDIVNIGSYVLQGTRRRRRHGTFRCRCAGHPAPPHRIPTCRGQTMQANGQVGNAAHGTLVFGRLDGQSASEPPSGGLTGCSTRRSTRLRYLARQGRVGATQLKRVHQTYSPT